jgi:N-acetylmuramoyl-L-alanine amidase
MRDPRFKNSSRFRLVILVAALPLSLIIFWVLTPGSQKQSPVTPPKSNMPFTLVIDPGHGGVDQGTSVRNGIKEKNITLGIAEEIHKLSPLYGIYTILTRDSDVFMNPLQRVEFASNRHADAYVSIHVNELKGYQYVSGMQVYVSNYNPKFSESCKLGSSIATNLSTDFKIFPRLEDRSENIYVLSQNPLPSVLIECGFITNPGDLKLLTDSTKILILAKQILAGVQAYRDNHVTQLYTVQLPGLPLSALHNKSMIAAFHPVLRKKPVKRIGKTNPVGKSGMPASPVALL